MGALGQGLLDAGDRRLNTSALLHRLRPRLGDHQETVGRISTACCDELLRRSELLATKLLGRLDPSGCGGVNEAAFLCRAQHALALELENTALAAGVRLLLADEAFADDLHMA